jgi:hypothetical protein
VQDGAAALAQHVDRAPERHDDVLEPLPPALARGRRGPRELYQRGDVVAVGEADLCEDGAVPAPDRPPGLGTCAVQQAGEHGRERLRIGRAVGMHPIGWKRLSGSGEHF